MSTYRLKILLPERKVYDGVVQSITVPGAGGLLTVLAGHEAMVALLRQGTVTVRTLKETLEAETGPGLLEVSQNEAAIMVRAFTWSSEATQEDAAAQNTSAQETEMLI